MMRGFALLFTLHFGDEHAAGDRWLSARQGEAFLHGGVRQSGRSAPSRVAGVARSGALVGATRR